MNKICGEMTSGKNMGRNEIKGRLIKTHEISIPKTAVLLVVTVGAINEALFIA